jgi:hypothetical protein
MARSCALIPGLVTTFIPLVAQAPALRAGLYLGGHLASVNLRIPGRDVEMEGIQFSQVRAATDRAGVKAYGGYWITPHVGFEVGFASLGNAEATFDYAAPPAETGTGVTKVGISNTTLAFLGGLRTGRWVLFLRGGVQFWTLRYETTFRPSGGGSQFRMLDRKGNSAFGGAGAEWNLQGPWHLRLEVEALKMDITDAKVLGLGLTYRF